MNLDQMVRALLQGQQALLDRVARLEAKLDALSETGKESARQAERLQERVTAVERVPAGRWNTLAQSAVSAVGTAVGAGLLAAAVYFFR